MVNVRARGQVLPIVGAVLLVVATLVPAAANLKPMRLPTDREQLEQDLAGIVDARQARIGELQVAQADTCDLRRGRELTKLLAMDGQFDAATSFADRFETVCGADDDVRRWGDAPRPHRGRHARVMTFDPTALAR